MSYLFSSFINSLILLSMLLLCIISFFFSICDNVLQFILYLLHLERVLFVQFHKINRVGLDSLRCAHIYFATHEIISSILMCYYFFFFNLINPQIPKKFLTSIFFLCQYYKLFLTACVKINVISSLWSVNAF